MSDVLAEAAAAGARAPAAAALGPGPGARTGFEVELLAPVGSSRAALAHELAARTGGSVARTFHADREPSLVPGMETFHTLTPAFEVSDEHGAPLCTLVDDVTILADLDRGAPAAPGWWRALTDDARLLRLLAEQVDPDAALDGALAPVAALFGTAVAGGGTTWRVDDRGGATVAMAASLVGQRERPCEVVTPPLVGDHLSALEALLAPARELGFTVPVEAAVHLHLDAAPFRTARAVTNVVRLFTWWRATLWEVLGTNARCQRLGELPEALVRLAAAPVGEEELEDPVSLERLRASAAGTLTKYADVNLTGVLGISAVRETLEVRILPGLAHGAQVVERSSLVTALLARCCEGSLLAPPRRAVDLDGLARMAEREG